MLQVLRPLEGTLSPAAMAWFGNAAKMRVIDRITADGRPKTVFDFGAGEGGGWAETLYHHPEIDLIAYEPDRRRAAVLRSNLPRARVVEGPDTIAARADIVVSFSVLEHVYDRVAYLATARRALKPGGTLFLNYDDGHFRHPGSRAEAWRNRLAPVLPWIGMKRHYQAPVRREAVDAMVRDAGFEIVDARYENLASLKALAKVATDRAEFARLWLETEDWLNASGGDELWSEMASRTLELARA